MSFRFSLGHLVATPGALALLQEAGQDPRTYIRRHINGDWGDLDPHDRKENEFSVKNGYRILSAYETGAGRIWIITEADRSATTILLPEEY